MSHLSTADIKTIVEPIHPVCKTANEKYAIIDLIFAGAPGKPDIDASGAPLECTRCFIFRLIDYGKVRLDKPALWAWLDMIHRQVEADKQSQIEILHTAISAAVTPSPYVAATEKAR